MSIEQYNGVMEELRDFLVQAITGTFMYQIKNKNNNITNDDIKYFFITYLNKCWHAFNKKNDKYLVDTFNKILNLNIIKGSVCLLNWIRELGEHMIDMINIDVMLDDLKEFDSFKEKMYAMDDMMDIAFDKLEPRLNIEKIKCYGNSCDSSYDGSDIFKLND